MHPTIRLRRSMCLILVTLFASLSSLEANTHPHQQRLQRRYGNGGGNSSPPPSTTTNDDGGNAGSEIHDGGMVFTTITQIISTSWTTVFQPTSTSTEIVYVTLPEGDGGEGQGDTPTAQQPAPTQPSTPPPSTPTPAPAPEPTPTTTTTTSQDLPPPPPLVTTSSSVPIPNTPTPIPEPETPTPTPTPPTTVTPPPQSSTSQSPNGGPTYTGDATWYNTMGGYGACGSILNDDMYIVAIGHHAYDLTTINGNPNNNAVCGRCINVYPTGKPSFQVRVADRCEACNDESLDFTETVFGRQIADVGVGRLKISWSFCDEGTW